MRSLYYVGFFCLFRSHYPRFPLTIAFGLYPGLVYPVGSQRAMHRRVVLLGFTIFFCLVLGTCAM